MVESLILHPALLIAAGFECISTRQARFLHAYRQHFGEDAVQRPATHVATTKDFELGGILNPAGHHYDPEAAFLSASTITPRFPYLQQQDILYHFYHPHIGKIWEQIRHELFVELEDYSITYRHPRDYFQPVTSVIYTLRDTAIYSKVNALHRCGLGDRLLDAFGYVFKAYREAQLVVNS